MIVRLTGRSYTPPIQREPPRKVWSFKAKPPYQIASDDERKYVAESCLKGSNSNRASYAREIIAGDLFHHDEFSLFHDISGYPKSYWHCLATVKPPIPEGRRGQWTAKPGNQGYTQWGYWFWDDWGAEPPITKHPSFEPWWLTTKQKEGK